MDKIAPDALNPALLTLRAGTTVLELAPQIGGAVAALYRADAAGRVDWLRPATAQALADHDVRAMASYPLVPFCNRIRDGRFSFAGEAVSLDRNETGTGHAIHGLGWQHAWAVEAFTQGATQAEARLGYTYQPAAAPEAGLTGWPWAFYAQQRFTLQAGRLALETRLENRSTRPMPAGLGQHPYLPHRAGTRLQVELDAMWQTDAQVMPTGELVRPDFLAALRAGTRLDEIAVDNNFTGWRHEATVEWPGLGRLKMLAGTPCDFFVLYSPSGADHFVIEPVTQCTDWVNLNQRFDSTLLGGQVLAPGQTLVGRMQLDFETF